MTGRLTASERAQYDRDGFLHRKNVFSPAEIGAMGRAIENVCSELVARKDRNAKKVRVSSFSVFESFWAADVVIKWEPSDPNRLKGLEPFAHLDPYLTEIASHPGFVEPMRDLIGCDSVGLFTEKLNLKRAHGGGGFAAHHDSPYSEDTAASSRRSSRRGSRSTTPTRTTARSKCCPEKSYARNRADANVGQTARVVRDRRRTGDMSRMRTIPARAGDVIFFGPFLVHRSGANQSDRDRRALLYTYQPAGLRTQLDNMRVWAQQSNSPSRS